MLGGEWTFNLNPVAASRPRFSKHGHAYFAGAYKQFRKDMIDEADVVLGELEPLQGPLSVDLEIFVCKPKSTKLHSPRGDIDNFTKAIFDSLNGRLWEDDRQIEKLYVVKCWTDSCEYDGWFKVGVDLID
mgnify:CR=1 FL=1|tara:strand:- start:1564 stop:1953 length:390 start_codon:yes stop_codon:yes gene_type:complete